MPSASKTKQKKQPKSNDLSTKAQKLLLSKVEKVDVAPFHANNQDGAEAACAFFKANGFVLIWLYSMEADRMDFKRRMITETWNKVMDNQAMTPFLRGQITKITDDKSYNDFCGELPGYLKQEHAATFGEMLFPHCGFGGPSMNAMWNMDCQWEARQNPGYARFAKLVFESDEVFCALDRPTVKFPGMGVVEWIHKDHRMDQAEPTNTEIQGKFCANEGVFVLVTGLQNEHKEMYTHYAPHYKNSNSAKWALLPDKLDHLNLFKRVEKIRVPAGATIFWSPSLVHGACMNDSKVILFGLYLGFVKFGLYLGFVCFPRGKHKSERPKRHNRNGRSLRRLVAWSGSGASS